VHTRAAWCIAHPFKTGLAAALVGRGIYITRNGAVVADPSEDFIKRDRGRARLAYLFKYAWRRGNVWLRDAADHAPLNYVTAIVGEREH
jgi:hypothetical protein